MRRWLGLLVVVGAIASACGGGRAAPTSTTPSSTAPTSTAATTTTQPPPSTTRPLLDHEAWPALTAYFEARKEAVRRKDPKYIRQFLDVRVDENVETTIETAVAADIEAGRTGKVTVHTASVQFERPNAYGEPSVSFEILFTDESKTTTFWYGMSKVEGRSWKLAAVSLQAFAV